MTRRRALALAAVWTVPSLCFLALAAYVYGTWRIDVPPRLSAEARQQIVAVLRAALDGTAPPPALPAGRELDRGLPGGGPVAVSLYLEGRSLVRIDGQGRTVRDAVTAAVTALAANPDVRALSPAQRAAVRLKVDVVVGKGPVELDHAVLQLVALHPGLEGLGVTVDGPAGVEHHLLLPDELFLFGLLAKKPLTKLMPEVGMGVEIQRADGILAARAGKSAAAWKQTRRRYFRFRTDAFVEATDRSQPPLPLTRGLPPGPPPTAANLREAALAGGRYLVDHLAPSGRYIYEQNLTTGQATDPTKPSPYSLPRHAGTTYFLAELYRHTKEPWLREPIERAFHHMDQLVQAGGCAGTLPDGRAFACVVDRGEKTASLGSTALGVVALVEYQRATGDPRYLPLANRLSEWMLWMQRPDGSFRHLYDVPNKVANDKAMLLYYSGEAALALARMYEVTGDERYAVAAEKALDWLVAWYDFFVGGLMYGEEHWTCIASEALWPRAKSPAYLDFCNGLARFWGQMQPHPGDHPDQLDLVGSHGVTPFVMPHNTPAGSHSEARISTYLLGRYHGDASPALRREILETLGYLLRQQIRPDNAYAVVPGAKGLGGIGTSPVDRMVRIDYVQHVCSAFIRGVELAEEEAGAPPAPVPARRAP